MYSRTFVKFVSTRFRFKIYAPQKIIDVVVEHNTLSRNSSRALVEQFSDVDAQRFRNRQGVIWDPTHWSVSPPDSAQHVMNEIGQQLAQVARHLHLDTNTLAFNMSHGAHNDNDTNMLVFNMMHFEPHEIITRMYATVHIMLYTTRP